MAELSLFSGANYGGIISSLGIVAKLLMFVAIFGVIGYFVYLYFIYNIRVDIIERTANGTLNIIRTRARKKRTKGGIVKWHLLRYKRIIPPVEISSLFRIKGKPYVILYRSSENDFHPITLADVKPIQFKVIPQEVLFWQQQQQKELYQRYVKESFLQKYGVIVGFTMLIGVFFILAILTLDKIEIVSSQAASAVKAFSTCAQPAIEAAQQAAAANAPG